MQNELPSTLAAPPATASVSVSELLRSVRDTLERRFPLPWVRGELSNLSRAASGHCYFTLKDGARAGRLRDVPQPRRGARLGAARRRCRSRRGRWSTLYEPRGRFQLTVEGMRRPALGPLYERFLRLKEKLEREGLFDAGAQARAAAASRARSACVTSLAAAALRDVLTTLARRNPAIPVIVYPVPVQGEGAAERIARDARARQRARRVRRAAAGARRRLDRGPVAVQRGGGGARHPRLRHPGGGRRRPRDRLHHRRLRRRPARADADRGRRAGQPVARRAARRASPSCARCLRARDAPPARVRRAGARRLRAAPGASGRAAALVPAAGDASSPRASPSPSRTACTPARRSSRACRRRCARSTRRRCSSAATASPTTPRGEVLRDAARGARRRAAAHRASRAASVESEVKKSDNP